MLSPKRQFVCQPCVILSAVVFFGVVGLICYFLPGMCVGKLEHVADSPSMKETRGPSEKPTIELNLLSALHFLTEIVQTNDANHQTELENIAKQTKCQLTTIKNASKGSKHRHINALCQTFNTSHTEDFVKYSLNELSRLIERKQHHLVDQVRPDHSIDVEDAIKCISLQWDAKEALLLNNVTSAILESYYINNNIKSETKSSVFQIAARKLLTVLGDEPAICRKGEQKVTDEIRHVVKNSLESDGANSAKLADRVLRYLEDKYSSAKKWLVICIRLEDDMKHLTKDIRYDYSRGFHTVVHKGIFIAVVSVLREEAPEFSSFANALIKDFKFPIETVKANPIGLRLSLQSKEEAHKIYKHFQNHMTHSKKKHGLGIDFLVITTPCSTAEKDAEDFVKIAVSNGFKWTRIVNQDACVNKQVIAIPSSVMRKTAAKPCTEKGDSGHLYNLLHHETPGYLTVEGDSNEEGKYVTVKHKEGHEIVTKWKFVNNTLRNENGKCLTAWTERSTYLYQYDCHPDWTGQIWIRYGLQIVNGFRFCLAIKEAEEGSALYAIQDFCDSSARFLWYDWNSECQQPLTISTHDPVNSVNTP